MKQRLCKIIYILAALIMLANSVFIIRDSINFSMDILPQGKEIYSVNSPDGDKVLTVYSIDNNLGKAVRADISDVKGKRNVYWQTGVDGVNSGWVNNSIIDINGIELNVEIGADYDCRRGYSIFREGSIEGKNVAGAFPEE